MDMLFSTVASPVQPFSRATTQLVDQLLVRRVQLTGRWKSSREISSSTGPYSPVVAASKLKLFADETVKGDKGHAILSCQARVFAYNPVSTAAELLTRETALCKPSESTGRKPGGVACSQCVSWSDRLSSKSRLAPCFRPTGWHSLLSSLFGIQRPCRGIGGQAICRGLAGCFGTVIAGFRHEGDISITHTVAVQVPRTLASTSQEGSVCTQSGSFSSP